MSDNVMISQGIDIIALQPADRVPVARPGNTTPYAATMAEVKTFVGGMPVTVTALGSNLSISAGTLNAVNLDAQVAGGTDQNGNGLNLLVRGAAGIGSGSGAPVTIRGGYGGTSGYGGWVNILGGNAGISGTDTGGGVSIQGGSGFNGAADGPVEIVLSSTSHLVLTNYPTSDPHVLGAVWADASASFVLKVSQG